MIKHFFNNPIPHLEFLRGLKRQGSHIYICIYIYIYIYIYILGLTRRTSNIINTQTKLRKTENTQQKNNCNNPENTENSKNSKLFSEKHCN